MTNEQAKECAKHGIKITFGSDGDVYFVTAITRKYGDALFDECWYEASDMSRCRAVTADNAISVAIDAVLARIAARGCEPCK